MRIVLREGRSDRVWIVLGGVKRPSFLLGSFGPFSSPSFEAPSFAAGLDGCAEAPPSAGGVRTAVLQSAGDSAHDLRGAASHGVLLISHLRFYPLLSPSFKKDSSSLFLFWRFSGTSRCTDPAPVLGPFLSAAGALFFRRRRRRRRRF